MSTLVKYKEEIKKLFFISVDKNIERWIGEIGGDYYSPDYNGTHFKIDKYSFCDYLKMINTNQGNESEVICTYRWFIFPINIKVWWYVKKLNRHFKKTRKEQKFAKNIEIIKIGLENIEKEFIKEVRKEKLEKIGI